MLECYLYNSQVVHDSRLMLSPFHIQNNKVEIKDGSVNIVCHFANKSLQSLEANFAREISQESSFR